MSKQPRRIDPQEKMDLVVEAARRLFVEQGFHNVSIPAIVRASGVSTGAIYHHFGNKESLARRIHDLTLGEFTRRLADKIDGREGTREKLRAYAELVLEIVEEDPGMMEYMLLVRHGEFLSDVPPVCEAEPFRWVQETLAEGLGRGEVRREDPVLAAACFTGVVLRVVQLYLQGVIRTAPGALVDPVFESAWAAVGQSA